METDPVRIEIPENSSLIGCYGQVGWVVDGIGFVLREFHDE